MSTTLPRPGEQPTPQIDPPEPPRPDVLDTWSPGMTDESGTLPVSDRDIDAADGVEPDPAEPAKPSEPCS